MAHSCLHNDLRWKPCSTLNPETFYIGYSALQAVFGFVLQGFGFRKAAGVLESIEIIFLWILIRTPFQTAVRPTL